jgi:hypothetical protein
MQLGNWPFIANAFLQATVNQAEAFNDSMSSLMLWT